MYRKNNNPSYFSICPYHIHEQWLYDYNENLLTTTMVTASGCYETEETTIISRSSLSSATQTSYSLSTCGDECPLRAGPFERNIPRIAAPYTNYVLTLSGVSKWVSQEGKVSGQWYDYPLLGRQAIGVNGIYGCTAVIISSEKGVYISHIWEDPVFVNADWVPTDDAYFTANSFNALRDGTTGVQSITALVGTDDQPGVLHAIYDPKVFILTPRTTDLERTDFQITTELRHQSRAEELANSIAGIIPGSGGTGYILGYKRTSEEESTKSRGTAGRAILEVDPHQTWLTTTAADADPCSLGLQVGRWCLWVEDKLITYQDFWLPDCIPGQHSIA